MKNFLYTSILCCGSSFVHAQLTDTISLGASYANQAWYQVESKNKSFAPKSNWEIAFSVQKPDAAIWIHPSLTLYRSKSALTAWAGALDTTGLWNTAPYRNSEVDWTLGAFNASSSGQFDYGWGSYNIATHNLTGDSIYILKYPDGSFKKIAIEKLAYDTAYTFKYANLDGQDARTVELKKATYGAKNFGYYSLTTHTATDREPLASDWDLTAWQYQGMTPDANGVLQPYLLTGFMQNRGVTVAKVRRDPLDNSLVGLSFKTAINTIGSDWKLFTNNIWRLVDSTAYFVKLRNGKIYKIVFTGFGGAANGNIIFQREYIQGTSVQDVQNGTSALAVYPNPATDGNIQMIYDLGDYVGQAEVQLWDMMGRNMWSSKVQAHASLQTQTLPFLNLSAGIYFVRLAYNGKQMTEKIIISGHR